MKSIVCSLRDPSLDAAECSLVYGGMANVLAFVVPLFHRSTDASLAFALLTQLLLLLTVLAITVAVVCGTELTQRLARSTRQRQSDHRHAGAASIGALGLFMSHQLHERALMAAAVLVFALIIAMHFVVRGDIARRVPRGWTNWSAGGLLALVPFLAQPRSDRGWPTPLAIAAAAAVVAFAVLPMLALNRRSPSRLARGWRRPAALALLCIVGWMPGLMAEEVAPALATRFEAAPALPHRPNVVVITLDTVRADHLSVYGYAHDTTPSLRRWWEHGATRYTSAFATSDMTLASHASIFTGLLPSEHGAHRHGSRPDTGLRPSADTLAARLHRAGFVTAGIAANAAYLSPRFGFNAGFDYYDARRPPRLTAPSPSYFFGGTLLYWLLAYAGPDFQFNYRSATQITDQALGLAPQLKATGRPFFLFLNMMDAHTPMVAPPAYRHAFGVRDDGFYWVREYPELVRDINSGARRITRNEHANLVASYDAAIAYLDAELGRLLRRLEELGVLDDSVIVITSDHGELFGRSGALGHDGVGLVPGVFHVPLLIRFPGDREARDDRRPVSAIDLYPTILESCGLSAERPPYARTLQSPAPWPQRPLFFESFESSWLAALHPRFRGDQRGALIDDRLIQIGREDRPAPGSWLSNRASGSTPALSPAILERAYAALHGLEQAAVIDEGMTPQADSPFDRLRSLGYVTP